MCIIVVKPEGAEIPNSNLYNMWMNNPHGAGLMYAQNGKLMVNKGLMTFPQFLSAYNKVADRKMVIHFRWRTHGPANQKLTHPFWIKQNIGMVHNGIIPSVKPRRKESDTSTYAWALQNRYRDPMVAMEDIAKRVEVLIDIGLSKLVFMNGNGRIQILNEQMGHWNDDGCWYSNHSYTDHKVYDETFGMVDYDPENWQVSAEVFEF